VLCSFFASQVLSGVKSARWRGQLEKQADENELLCVRRTKQLRYLEFRSRKR
jgi:hypothetical protein